MEVDLLRALFEHLVNFANWIAEISPYESMSNMGMQATTSESCDVR